MIYLISDRNASLEIAVKSDTREHAMEYGRTYLATDKINCFEVDDSFPVRHGIEIHCA